MRIFAIIVGNSCTLQQHPDMPIDRFKGFPDRFPSKTPAGKLRL